MKIYERRRVVSAVLALWLAAGGWVSTGGVAALEHHAHSGFVTVTSARTATDDGMTSAISGTCAASVSCGGGCTAELTIGYCLTGVSWEGRIELGGIQIGPKITASCNICECWYRYTNAMGNQIFKRTTSLGCGASFPGIDVHVA